MITGKRSYIFWWRLRCRGRRIDESNDSATSQECDWSNKERKNAFRTCRTHFRTILNRSLQNNDVKWLALDNMGWTRTEQKSCFPSSLMSSSSARERNKHGGIWFMLRSVLLHSTLSNANQVKLPHLWFWPPCDQTTLHFLYFFIFASPALQLYRTAPNFYTTNIMGLPQN